MSDLIVLVTTLCLSLIGTYQHMIATSHQETEVMQLLVNTDVLTGLANQLSVSAQLSAVPECAVLLIDLDDFQNGLRQSGQSAADQVLIDLSRLLREVIGTNGSVGRWGQHQFTVLLPYASKFAALDLAEELRARIAGMNSVFPITASIGVATPGQTEEGTATLGRATAQLLVAQRAGGNRLSYA